MALVGFTLALSCGRERLAGAGACPKRSVIRPSCEASCVGPASDAGEEMALGVSLDVVGSDINDAPFINVARCNVPSGDQVAQPLSGVRVDLVVICRHHPLR